MRIERTGNVARITPQVVRFLTDTLGGISLDEFHSPEGTRIDFSCLRGLLAVELKSLKEAGTERLANLTNELSQREDWPIFLGSAPMQSFIRNMKDPEGVERQVLNRMGRAIINHLKKANRQLAAHAVDYPRQNMVRLLLLVNEDHEVYDPHTVSYILWHAVRRKDGDRVLYEHIDGIIFLTQRHATVKKNKLTYPIVTVEGRECYDHPWKRDVFNLVVRRWAEGRGYESMESGSLEEFSTIDHIPEQASRSDRWRTDYKRNPHLRSLTKEQLRASFDEVALLSALFFLKDAPIEVTMDDRMVVIQRFSDFMEEMGERGIPITDFPQDETRERDAAQRLGLQQHVIDWFLSFTRR